VTLQTCCRPSFVKPYCFGCF